MAVDKKHAHRMGEENSDDESLFGSDDDDARSKGSKRTKGNSGGRQRPPGSRGRQHWQSVLKMPRTAKIQMTPPTRSVSAVTTRFVNLTPGIRLSSLACNANETSLELDSHADTCVIGEKALIIADYCRPVTVHAYDKELGERTYRTVSAVVGYTCPSSGATYHLVIHIRQLKYPTWNIICYVPCSAGLMTLL